MSENCCHAGPQETGARDALLALDPYTLDDREKNEDLMPIFREQLKDARGNNRHIEHYFSKLQIDIDALRQPEDVPFIPVQMFKHFDLRTCPENAVAKVLQSSGTTGASPSRIPLDKSTTLNQIKALKAILSDYLGKNRKIFLVVDHEGINKPEMAFSARTAGVRGRVSMRKKPFTCSGKKRGG